ncbi:hypothetical protein AAMO2058_001064400 [Amorphochlora amoebiformis]
MDQALSDGVPAALHSLALLLTAQEGKKNTLKTLNPYTYRKSRVSKEVKRVVHCLKIIQDAKTKPFNIEELKKSSNYVRSFNILYGTLAHITHDNFRGTTLACDLLFESAIHNVLSEYYDQNFALERTPVPGPLELGVAIKLLQESPGDASAYRVSVMFTVERALSHIIHNTFPKYLEVVVRGHAIIRAADLDPSAGGGVNVVFFTETSWPCLEFFGHRVNLVDLFTYFKIPSVAWHTLAMLPTQIEPQAAFEQKQMRLLMASPIDAALAPKLSRGLIRLVLSYVMHMCPVVEQNACVSPRRKT